MKKTQLLAIAALAAAATFQTAAKAEDPVSPLSGSVCNLYWLDIPTSKDPKEFKELAGSLLSEPAAATFVDTAADFKVASKRPGINSSMGMWTGWLKQEKAGTYTFLCKRGSYNEGYYYRYSIWINGQKCVDADYWQTSFNVELNAGFNEVKIIAGSMYNDRPYPLSITYKKAGSVKDPVSFGPGDMFYDDEE